MPPSRATAYHSPADDQPPGLNRRPAAANRLNDIYWIGREYRRARFRTSQAIVNVGEVAIERESATSASRSRSVGKWWSGPGFRIAAKHAESCGAGGDECEKNVGDDEGTRTAVLCGKCAAGYCIDEAGNGHA